jgi:hypothetical protein
MTDGEQPLIAISGIANKGPKQQGSTPDIIRGAKLELTDLGRAVLKGEADFVSVAGIDFWLGGVHLSRSRNLWRWDEESGVVIRSKPR